MVVPKCIDGSVARGKGCMADLLTEPKSGSASHLLRANIWYGWFWSDLPRGESSRLAGTLGSSRASLHYGMTRRRWRVFAMRSGIIDDSRPALHGLRIHRGCPMHAQMTAVMSTGGEG